MSLEEQLNDRFIDRHCFKIDVSDMQTLYNLWMGMKNLWKPFHKWVYEKTERIQKKNKCVSVHEIYISLKIVYFWLVEER